MSTPTSTSSRKRKADALEFADDAESPPGRKLKAAATPSAHLPASCLAAVLNFMEYAEVRRCLLAGKLLAVDAARHVEVLNIMNASELVPSAARRFANITEINILSLVKEAEEAPVEDEVDDEFILSADTATRSAFFLTTFPKLKRTFLGGVYWDPGLNKWEKFPYYHTACIEPNDHLSVFRGLIDHLCGAFRSRSLSPSLHLGGVLRDNQLECHDDDHDFAIVDGRVRLPNVDKPNQSCISVLAPTQQHFQNSPNMISSIRVSYFVLSYSLYLFCLSQSYYFFEVVKVH